MAEKTKKASGDEKNSPGSGSNVEHSESQKIIETDLENSAKADFPHRDTQEEASKTALQVEIQWRRELQEKRLRKV